MICCVHSFVYSFVSQIFCHITVRAVVISSPPSPSSSEEMLSTPADFPAFRLCTASCASAHVGCQPLARGSDYSGVGLCLGGIHSCVLTALLSPPVQNSCALSQVVDDCCSRCGNGKEEKYEHPALSPVKDKADATDKCSSARVAQHSIYSSRCSFLSARARSRVHTHTHTHTHTYTHTHTHIHTHTHAHTQPYASARIQTHTTTTTSTTTNNNNNGAKTKQRTKTREWSHV